MIITNIKGLIGVILLFIIVQNYFLGMYV